MSWIQVFTKLFGSILAGFHRFPVGFACSPCSAASAVLRTRRGLLFFRRTKRKEKSEERRGRMEEVERVEGWSHGGIQGKEEGLETGEVEVSNKIQISFHNNQNMR
ncbi:hypothetical protein Dimus_028287 [Dionaea muscipula]